MPSVLSALEGGSSLESSGSNSVTSSKRFAPADRFCTRAVGKATTTDGVARTIAKSGGSSSPLLDLIFFTVMFPAGTVVVKLSASSDVAITANCSVCERTSPCTVPARPAGRTTEPSNVEVVVELERVSVVVELVVVVLLEDEDELDEEVLVLLLVVVELKLEEDVEDEEVVDDVADVVELTDVVAVVVVLED
mmetsp:Transcript_54859/g.128054  ORF Transcript_54859/g.128054 Transcript_54859/m.128054 type:complete len:193 (+) Transcript_54859:15-593(+)